jgi:hypothetical protein
VACAFPVQGALAGVSCVPLCAMSGCGRWVLSLPTPFPLGAVSLAACGRVGGVRGKGEPSAGCRARAHARLNTRRVRARARAPRLQPSAQSRFRCHCLLPGAAAYPEPGVLFVGPLAPRQEDELEEDAWAREYSGGCGPGGY